MMIQTVGCVFKNVLLKLSTCTVTDYRVGTFSNLADNNKLINMYSYIAYARIYIIATVEVQYGLGLIYSIFQHSVQVDGKSILSNTVKLYCIMAFLGSITGFFGQSHILTSRTNIRNHGPCTAYLTHLYLMYPHTK